MEKEENHFAKFLEIFCEIAFLDFGFIEWAGFTLSRHSDLRDIMGLGKGMIG